MIGRRLSQAEAITQRPTGEALGDDYSGSDWVSGYWPSARCAGGGQVDKLGWLVRSRFCLAIMAKVIDHYVNQIN